MPRPAAIFDVDGTLLGRGSAERHFLRRALRARLITPLHLLAGAGSAVADWATGRSGLYAASKRYLRGIECAPLEALGVQSVHEDVRPHLREDLLRELEGHRANGRAIVLLTGTLDFLGTEIARLVGADLVAGAILERRDGRFTGRVVPPYPHGAGKVEALLALAGAAELDLAASHAYANHGSDVAHLERVGHPHAVVPDRRLRRVARARGWSLHDDARWHSGSPGARPRG
jgi:HAD superfamily hydrolase (TIGR01490 family)